MKAMVVEDNKDARVLLTEQLRALGVETVGCGDGREAVDRYPTEKPDIVIMDVAMPQMDGLEATAQLRRIDPDASIFVISAYSEDMIRRAALAAGADRFFLKEEMDRMLAQVCRRMGGEEEVKRRGEGVDSIRGAEKKEK
ncbi:MAG: response regulator [Bacteroidetes bacterium]|nr:response regulator [Bacteroidota bacterium]